MSPDPQFVGVPEPIKVAVVAGTGDGGLPHDMHDQVLATPGSAVPNVVVKVVPVALALFVRFGNAYFTTLVGIVTAGLTTYGSEIMPSSDFADLVWKSSLLAVSGPSVAFLKDLVTIFGKLEQKFPLMTGNV
jgi:hypothetical protein